jgi:hypothetical protein
MARFIVLENDERSDKVHVGVRFDDIPWGSITVAAQDIDRWLAWATWKYDGVTVLDRRTPPEPPIEPNRLYLASPYEGENHHIIKGREAKMKTGRRAICGAPVQAKATIYSANPDASNCYRCRKKTGQNLDGWGLIQNMGGRRYR